MSDSDNTVETDTMANTSAAQPERRTPANTRIGGYIAGSSLAVFVLAAVICGAAGLTGAASRPVGLLQSATMSETAGSGEEAGPKVRLLPQQELEQTITLNVCRIVQVGRMIRQQ